METLPVTRLRPKRSRLKLAAVAVGISLCISTNSEAVEAIAPLPPESEAVTDATNVSLEQSFECAVFIGRLGRTQCNPISDCIGTLSDTEISCLWDLLENRKPNRSFATWAASLLGLNDASEESAERLFRYVMAPPVSGFGPDGIEAGYKLMALEGLGLMKGGFGVPYLLKAATEAGAEELLEPWTHRPGWHKMREHVTWCLRIYSILALADEGSDVSSGFLQEEYRKMKQDPCSHAHWSSGRADPSLVAFHLTEALRQSDLRRSMSFEQYLKAHKTFSPPFPKYCVVDFDDSIPPENTYEAELLGLVRDAECD